MTKRLRRFLGSVACIAFLTGVGPGCAGGGLADDLTVRPTARPLGVRDARPLRIPADEKFSITASPAQKAPGLAGAAEANASAKREGEADARAAVQGGGTAAAAFQLGHAFANDSERQVDLRVLTRFTAEYATSAAPADAAPGPAVSLRLFARDARGRLRQQINVVAHGSDGGDVSSRDNRELSLVATLAPGDALYVYLAGSVTIENRENQSSSGSLSVKNVEMEVTSQAAPAVPGTTQPSR